MESTSTSDVARTREDLNEEVESLRRQVAEQGRLIDDLQASLAEVKRLNGLLLICSCCKRIRKSDGEWQQMELFIREHSEADFSHGLCPDCAEKTYTRFVGQMAHKLPD